MPDNCVFLVDTYHSIKGVLHAIEVAKQLRATGHEMLGIRIDSGDLAKISIEARKLLDEAGFEKSIIFASNSLDEDVIASLKAQHAPINAWGVGTHLVTAYDHPALDGVYKLMALRDPAGVWQPKLKLSEQAAKISTPGRHQVRRFYEKDRYLMDMIVDLDLPEATAMDAIVCNPLASLADNVEKAAFIELLIPVFNAGVLIHQAEPIEVIRTRAITERNKFLTYYPLTHYPVTLAKNLFQKKEAMIHLMKT